MKIEALVIMLNAIMKETFPDFKGTYVFGSRLRKSSPESDYDLMFAFGHRPDWIEKNRVYDLVAEIEMQEHIVIDAKAYSEHELKSVWTPFREKVLKEGKYFAAA